MLAVISIIFFVVILALGVLAGRTLKSASDWAGAGKNLGWFTIAMLVVSFQIGGTSIIGAAQYGYTMGIAGIWYALAGSIAMACSTIFTKRLRAYVTEDTLTNFLDNRYNKKVGNIYSTMYLLMGFVYIPIQLFTLTTIIRTVIPGLSLGWASVIGLLLAISYIVVSGIQGAGLVSKISALLMYATLIVGVGVIFSRTGGFANLHANLPESYFSIFTMPTMTWISWFITVFVAFTTMQAAIQPVLVGKDNRNAITGIIVAALVNLPCGFLCSWIGMVGKTKLNLENSSLAFASTVHEFLPDWLTGMLFAGIGLIIVCTLSGQMLAVGTIIRKVLSPVYQKRKISDRKELTYTRLFTFLYAFLTIIPTFLIEQTMLNQLVTILIACVTGPMFFSIVGGMYWKKITAKAAAWSMIAGIIVGLAWTIAGQSVKLQPIYLILPVSAVVGIVVTLSTQPKNQIE